MSSSTSASSQCRKISQEELSDSWVTCELDTESEHSGILSKEMERLLRDAQRESGQSSLVSTPKSSKVSSSPNTPCNSPQSSPSMSGHVSPSSEKPAGQQISAAGEKKVIDDRELVWTWASTPEIQPRRNVSYKRPQRKPLSLSFRKTPAMKSGIFSWDFLKIFIPSLIFSHILAIGIGVYIGRRSNQSSASAV